MVSVDSVANGVTSGTDRPIITARPFLTLHDGAMDVGDNGLGV